MRTILILLTLFITGCSANLPKESNSLIDKLEGTWDTVGEKSCNGSGYTHKIELVENKSKVKFTFYKEGESFVSDIKAVYTYTIIKELNDRVVMQVDGEKRTTENGDLVIWEFIFETDGSYSWRRTDWSATDRVKPFQKRCNLNA